MGIRIGRLPIRHVHYMFHRHHTSNRRQTAMTDQIVITEKTSQAKDVRAAVGSPLRRYPAGRGPSVRPSRARGRRAGLEALDAVLLRPDGLYGTRPRTGRQQGRQAEGDPRRAAQRYAGLARHRLRPRRPADRSGDPGALRLSRRGHAGDVHRPGPADHPRRLRPGQAERRICPPLRRRRRAPAGRPDLQPVADPHRDRDPGARHAQRHRRRPGEDADPGHRLQARAGDPQLRAAGLFRGGRHGDGRGWPVPDAARAQGADRASARTPRRSPRPPRALRAARRAGRGQAAGTAAAARSAVAAETVRLALRLVGASRTLEVAQELYDGAGQEGHHLSARRDPLPAARA